MKFAPDEIADQQINDARVFVKTLGRFGPGYDESAALGIAEWELQKQGYTLWDDTK